MKGMKSTVRTFLKSTANFLPLPLVAIGVLIWMGWTDSPQRFPQDVQWWEGRVLHNFVWYRDGDQDILTEDGHYLVVDWPGLLEPGDSFYLLHAKASDGGQRTFFCTERKREACGSLSLAVNPPFEAHTFNQGVVPASSRGIDHQSFSASNPALSTLGHFVRKGERG